MAVTNQLNSQVVKTELDGVFFQEYMYPTGPGIATAETADVFKQMTITNAAYITDIASGGGGFWVPKGEEQNVNQASPRFTNKVTYTAVTFANSIQISKEFFDDNMHGAYTGMVKDFAFNARATRDKTAFALWNNAFTTTLTADGEPFVSTSHQTIAGPVVSNRVKGDPVLSTTGLDAARVQLLQQVSQDGVVMGQEPAVLLVAPKEFQNAQQITNSALVAENGNNAINIYSSMYGIRVYQSPYLGTVMGGNDKAWFLLSRNHGVTRYIREGITTTLVDWTISSNDNYVYKGRYREEYGVADYVGVVGSNPS